MTKTEAMIGNLNLKECDSILEFLFSDFGCPNGIRMSCAKAGSQGAAAVISEHDARLKIRASISNEIKNPLEYIISGIEFLYKVLCRLQGRLKKHTKDIQKGFIRLEALFLRGVENIKLECEKFALKKQKIETRCLIENMLKTFEEQFSEKNITIHAALIQADIVFSAAKFNKILYSIVDSSVKCAGQNSEISFISRVEGDIFYFEVKNTGSFINKNEAKKVFKLLYSNVLNPDVRKNFPEGRQNSGAELYHLRRLVEALKGKLKFESTKKRAVFRFCLPVKLPVK